MFKNRISLVSIVHWVAKNRKRNEITWLFQQDFSIVLKVHDRKQEKFKHLFILAICFRRGNVCSWTFSVYQLHDPQSTIQNFGSSRLKLTLLKLTLRVHLAKSWSWKHSQDIYIYSVYWETEYSATVFNSNIMNSG